MSLSNEEINDIASKVADQVFSAAQRCRCGHAVWLTNNHLTLLEALAREERKEPIRDNKAYDVRRLDDVEESCGVDLGAARDNLEHFHNFAESGSWEEARQGVQAMREDINDALYICSVSETYPEQGGHHSNPDGRQSGMGNKSLLDRIKEEKEEEERAARMYFDLAEQARRIGEHRAAETLAAIARDERRHNRELLNIQLRMEGYRP